MRADSVTLKLVFVTLVMALALPSAQAAGPSHAVVCQAYMMALDKVNPEYRANPMVSIQELQGYLLRSRGLPQNWDVSDKDPYLHENYFDSFTQPSRFSVGRMAFKHFIARLAQLQKDAISNEPDIARVAVELRGEQAVMQYLEILERDYAATHAAVDAELNRKFPRLRAGNIAHGVSQALLLGFGTAAILNEPDALAYLAGGLSVYTSAAVEFLFRAMPWSQQNRGLKKQLEVVRRCSRGECPDYPVTIVSGNLKVPTEFHRAVMGSETMKLDDLVRQSEVSRLTISDSYFMRPSENKSDVIVRIKNSPDGITRKLFFDSIFYMDPVRNEPVWLVYYRAFKDAPVFKPPKKEKKEAAEEESWGLLPGIAPVPTR